MAYGYGKVILLGEHGVVYGRPALAASLGRGVSAQAHPAATDRLRLSPWDVDVAPDPDSDELLSRALAAVVADREQERPPLHIDAQVELPGSAGLGCSAALGVAVIGAIDAQLGRERSREELAEASLCWERVFHGTPSGVDSAMAAGAGLAVYRRGEPLDAIAAPRPIRLVVGHSGEPGSTKQMVEEVGRQHAASPERLEQTFDAMASLVRNAQLALERGDLQGLGKLMDLNQALLSSLMVSTAKLEEMCDTARNSGALGAKLTGGGGGGCMIALVDDDDAAERVRRTLAEIGHQAFIAQAGA